MSPTTEFGGEAASRAYVAAWLAQPMAYRMHTPQPTPNSDDDEDDDDDERGGGSGGGSIDPEEDEGWSDDDDEDEEDETLWTVSLKAAATLPSRPRRKCPSPAYRLPQLG